MDAPAGRNLDDKRIRVVGLSLDPGFRFLREIGILTALDLASVLTSA